MKSISRSILTACTMVVCLGCSEPPSAIAPPQDQTPNSSSADQSVSETQRLNQWLDARYEEKLARQPMRMTRLGRKDRYDEIDELSEAAEDKELQWHAATVDVLKADFNYPDLSDDARISYDLWIYQYEAAKALAPYRRHQYIFTQMMGRQSYLPAFLIEFHKVDNKSDMFAYVSRIGGISRAMRQLLERAKLGAAGGVRPPRFACEAVIEEAQNMINGAPFTEDSNQESPLWADANAKIAGLLEAKSIDEDIATELKDATKEALLQNFLPAYTELINWFEADIENCSDIALGVGALPNGEALYKAMLEYRTTSKLTASQIHEIGLQEVSRIRDEMEGIKKNVGFEGSLDDFFEFVRSDQKFYYTNDEAGRQRYIERSETAISFINDKLPEYFGRLPKADLVVKRVEAFREQDGAFAFYSRGTPDGSRPGTYYLHLSDMSALNTTEMEAVAYHEGNPGHHMQVSIALELEDIPEFRTQAWFNSYGEGWALYSEALAKEMGAYGDPYSDFGRLTGELWRANRLVVDTGIHAKNWTEKQAVNYFLDNSTANETAVVSEVRRYFVWPGQATSYKIGMLKIQELRADAEAQLGDKFDIRGFHDAILGGGPLPEPILDRAINNWIEEIGAN
ncbi:DUF885 family protein [Pseudomonadota bacterium]